MRKKTLSKNEIFPKAARKRVIIEAVRPNVDGGRYPIKRTVGEKIVVTADIFTDGHDAISAYLSYKHASEKRWHAAKMAPLGNDVWRGTFTVDQPPRFQYTIAAWIDRFASWRTELEKRVDAGQDVAGELLEGASLVMAAARRAKASDAQFLRERA
ncbi:MAG: maltotransferase domain-containing protein, partial [Nitrospiria bacterium]